MKKIVISLLAGSILFAANSDLNAEINKKLDLLLNKIDMLEKKLEEKDKEIEKLKKEIKTEIKKQEIKTKKELAIKSCDNLKVTNVSYEYHDNVLPYVTFSVTIENDYPYEVTKLNGNLYFDDKDGTTLIKHYLNRDVKIPPKKSVVIKGQHMILNEIEKEIKDEKPSDLKVYFSPNEVEFKGAPTLKCY